MANKRNDEINILTKESIALAYAKLITNNEDESITNICKSAGVSRNAYYRNFSSTEEIIIYYLILKWSKYCENYDDNEISKDIGKYLIEYFYSEKEFLRSLKKRKQVYLVEELFRKTLIPDTVVGNARYISYVTAYVSYSFIRAMIDNDFSETPEQIQKLVIKNNS